MLKVSVVIPTRNRSLLLDKTIECIEAQTIPRDQYEVIVIDNDSTDDTRRIIEKKSRIYSNLKSGFQEKPGAAATRNTGLRMAKGELVLFIDDDVHAEPSLIEAHLDRHRQGTNVSVIGAVSIPWGDTTEPFLRYLRDHRILNPYTPSKGRIDFSYYHTCNVSTPTDVLMKVGGFNEAFTIYGMEDIELGYRLEKAGSQMIFAPEAKAIHYRFPAYEEFSERCEHAGYSLGQLLVFHPELKKRFVESGKITRHLKGLHPIYGMATLALNPPLKLLTAWDRGRGSGVINPILDLHYTWSIRYHIFLGYRRFVAEHSQMKTQLVPAIQTSLAKKTVNE
jgi:glycosyltransferase involved in cell wall biosynthesis